MVNDQTGGMQPNTKTSTAQHEAAGLAEDAANAGQHVGEVAKGEASKVASEAGHQAKDLLHQVRSEVRDQAGVQQQKVADGLRSVGKELSSMAKGSEENGMATDLVQQAAGRVDHVADWLEKRDPGSLLEEVKSFGRRRPGVFIAVAAGAGLLAGRLTRAIVDESHTSNSGASGSRSGGQNAPVSTDMYGTEVYPDARVGYAPGTAAPGAVAPGITASGAVASGTAAPGTAAGASTGNTFDETVYDEYEADTTDATRPRPQGGGQL